MVHRHLKPNVQSWTIFGRGSYKNPQEIKVWVCLWSLTRPNFQSSDFNEIRRLHHEHEMNATRPMKTLFFTEKQTDKKS